MSPNLSMREEIQVKMWFCTLILKGETEMSGRKWEVAKNLIFYGVEQLESHQKWTELNINLRK